MTDSLTRYLELMPHVGAERGRALRREGCLCWRDLLDAASPLAGFDRTAWDAARAAAEAALRALDADDATYFTTRLAPREQWRVLAHWFDRASFFDIETSGLDADSMVNTLQMTLQMHFGTEKQTQKIVTLRLRNSKENVMVGEFTVD